MNEQTFLAALHDSPADEVTWLALADWFEENDQPRRAELVRLTRRMLALPFARGSRTKKRRELETQVVALIAAGVRPAVPEVVNSLGMRFALIPPGRFRMGAPSGEPRRESDEGAHPVEITKPFYLGVFPVTQEQYRKVRGRNPSLIRAGSRNYGAAVGDADTSNYPVENVTFADSRAFCKKLAEREAEKKAKHTYRLPTEAEWEYACRAGTTSYTFFGDSLGSALANINGHSPYNGAEEGPALGRSCDVGSYPPNAWGTYDMHGQVWEWCSDWYEPFETSSVMVKDPTGPKTGSRRAMRGGAWMVNGEYARSASRAWAVPEEVDAISGFRVVLVRG